jgi:hypothetical protein
LDHAATVTEIDAGADIAMEMVAESGVTGAARAVMRKKVASGEC